MRFYCYFLDVGIAEYVLRVMELVCEACFKTRGLLSHTLSDTGVKIMPPFGDTYQNLRPRHRFIRELLIHT